MLTCFILIAKAGRLLHVSHLFDVTHSHSAETKTRRVETRCVHQWRNYMMKGRGLQLAVMKSEGTWALILFVQQVSVGARGQDRTQTGGQRGAYECLRRINKPHHRIARMTRRETTTTTVGGKADGQESRGGRNATVHVSPSSFIEIKNSFLPTSVSRTHSFYNKLWDPSTKCASEIKWLPRSHKARPKGTLPLTWSTNVKFCAQFEALDTLYVAGLPAFC